MMQRGVHMLNIIIKTIITFLTIYAICSIFSSIITNVFKSESSGKDVFVFIHVKNQEESIEYIVRCTVLNYLNHYGGRVVPYVVIVDKGSEDNTEVISKKLCEDYDFVYYTTEENYEKFRRDIN